MFLVEGEVAFIKVSLKIFTIIEPELFQRDYAETIQLLQTCTTEVDPKIIFKNIQTMSLNQEKWAKYNEKEKKKKKEGIKNIFN